MARLLHGLGQRHASPRGFGQIAGAQAMRGKSARIETGGGATPFDHRIDALINSRIRAWSPTSFRPRLHLCALILLRLLGRAAD